MSDQDTAGGSQDEDVWCEVDADGSDGSPQAVAAVLEKVATVLRDAPDGKRYDFELEVEER